MRHLKTVMIMVASLVLPAIMGLTGCGEDHGNSYHGDRDRAIERNDRQDGNRHEDRQPSDRRDNCGSDSSRAGDRSDR